MNSPIFHKELFAICVVIYMAPSNCSLRIFTDNTNVIAVVKSGGNQEIPSAMVRWMIRCAARKQISVDIRWVKTMDN